MENRQFDQKISSLHLTVSVRSLIAVPLFQKVVLLFMLYAGMDTPLCAQRPIRNHGMVWEFPFRMRFDFRTEPVIVTGHGAFRSSDAVGSICDLDGNLLLYSNGMSIWNREHQLMPNGTGLLGDSSSTQGALIVPWPESDSLYYVFCLSEENIDRSTLSFKDTTVGIWTCSVVDMSLDSGRGDVLTKNRVLMQSGMSEQQAACYHGNGRDIWLVGRQSERGKLIRYLITPQGLQGPKWITPPFYNPTTYRSVLSGQSRFSPSGEYYVTTRDSLYDWNAVIVLTRFDVWEGTFSDTREVDLTAATGALNAVHFWTEGFDFSPCGRYLYYNKSTNFREPNTPTKEEIIQLDVEALFQKKEIRTSVFPLLFPLEMVTEFRLASDGRVYFMNDYRKTIGRINRPSEWGDEIGLEFDFAPFDRDTTNSVSEFFRDFPEYVSTYFYDCDVTLDIPDQVVCDSRDGVLLDADIPYAHTWRWSDGSTDSVLWVTEDGTYSVEVDGHFCNARDTVEVVFKDCPDDPSIPDGARLFIPNVFTPNGDGVNDRFRIPGVTTTPWSLRIYNRWGAEVYASDVYQNDWDGHGLTNGLYYYRLRSETFQYEYKGWVKIMR